MRAPTITLILLLVAPFAWAQDQQPSDDPAAPPPLPPPRAATGDDGVAIPPKVQDEQIDPDVRISEDAEGNLVEEYRQDGQVYMVKVTPRVGPAYYYFDDDGDGQLELRESDAAAYPVKPVYWKVKEWD
jgi:hypothetical protein